MIVNASSLKNELRRIAKSLFGNCRLCDISGGDKPLPYENQRGGGRSGGVYPRLSLPASGNLDFPNTL
jgi:hypothetical protein